MSRPLPVLLLAAVILASIAPVAPASSSSPPVALPGWTQGTPFADCGVAGDASHAAEEARPIAVPGVCHGWEDATTGPGDTYVFDLSAGWQARIVASAGVPSTFSVCLGRLDALPNCAWTSSEGAPLAYEAPSDGPVYVRVIRASPVGGPYAFTIEALIPPGRNDCQSGRDATAAAPVGMLLDVRCAGYLAADDGEDTFTLVVDDGDRLDLRYEGTGQLCVTRPGFARWCTPGWITYSYLSPPRGTWIIEVGRGSGSSPPIIEYAFTPTILHAPPQEDCGSDGDADVRPIMLPATCTGDLDPEFGDWWDQYSFHAERGELVAVALDAPDARVCLTHPEAWGDWACGGYPDGPTSQLRYLIEKAGTWTVKVRTTNATPQTYGLQITRSPGEETPHVDCGTSGDAPEDAAQALFIDPAVCVGEQPLLSFDREDWYAVDTQAGDTISFTVTPTVGSLHACLYRPSGALERCDHSANLPNLTASFARPVEEEGRWTLQLWSRLGVVYDLDLFGTPTQNDCGAGRDASESPENAVSIPRLVSCQGEFPAGHFDGGDWYRVSAEAGETIDALLVAVPFDALHLCAHRPGSREPMVCSDEESSLPEHLRLVADTSGEWLLSVGWIRGSGEYDLHVSVGPASSQPTPRGA